MDKREQALAELREIWGVFDKVLSISDIDDDVMFVYEYFTKVRGKIKTGGDMTLEEIHDHIAGVSLGASLAFALTSVVIIKHAEEEEEVAN